VVGQRRRMNQSSTPSSSLSTSSPSPLVLTLDLSSSVLKFDIVQFWKINSTNEKITCHYFYISQNGRRKIPKNELLQQKHILWSETILRLSELCDSNIGQYIWMSSSENNNNHDDEIDIASKELTIELSEGNDSSVMMSLPMKTILVHRIKALGDEFGYLMCYSFKQLEYSSKKIDYISTLCDAAFLSTSVTQSGFVSQMSHDDLDSKDFFFLDSTDEISIPQRPLNQISFTSEDIVNLILQSDSLSQSERERVAIEEEETKRLTQLTIQTKKDANRRKSSLPTNVSWSYTNRTLVSPAQAVQSALPSLSPVFSINELPIVTDAPDDLSIELLTDFKHIAYGVHAALMTAIFHGIKVFVKLMISELVSSSLAQREFEYETAFLRRVDHPNIVKILGSGIAPDPKGPRRFIVLEYLEDGLVDMISTSKGTDKLIRKLLPSHKSIPFSSVLLIARDVANALDYLHTGVSPEISLIHCQVEPENIRFDSNGVVKLIGFRSSTCMRRREPYSKKGFPVLEHSGTLRYTPPEVALRLSYSEKSDVYQFGIVLWQIARDKVPFLGFTKTEYLNRVVYGNERPKIDKTWPPEFVFLLEQCCHTDQFRRPTMESIENNLENLLQQISPGSRLTPKKRLSWKILKHSSEDSNEEKGLSTHGATAAAVVGKRGVSARRTIGESDRKSAWF
jgi:serine/threonine protein kinase